MIAEAYLEPNRTVTMGLFAENSYIAVNYFCEKAAS